MRINKVQRDAIVECLFRAITKRHETTVIDDNTIRIVAHFDGRTAVITLARTWYGSEFVKEITFDTPDDEENETTTYKDIKVKVGTCIIPLAVETHNSEKEARLLDFTKHVVDTANQHQHLTRIGC